MAKPPINTKMVRLKILIFTMVFFYPSLGVAGPLLLPSPEQAARDDLTILNRTQQNLPLAEKCHALYANILKGAKEAADAMQGIYFENNAPAIFNAAAKIRDKVRKRLQYFNRHDYPVMALDDGTPVKAYSFASDAFEKLSTKQKELIGDISQIESEIKDLLQVVNEYPAKYRAHVDETATFAAQVPVLQDTLAKGLQRTHDIQLELPFASVAKNGEVTIRPQSLRFPSDVAVWNYLRDMKEQLKRRTSPQFFGLNETGKINVSQAIAVKKLETYFQEYQRQVSLNLGAKPKASAEDLMKQIRSLYQKDEMTLKPEFRLPRWAWDKIRWIQLSGEIKSVVYRDLPDMRDKVMNSKLMEFVRSLSEDDKRALGLGNLATVDSKLARVKWYALLMGVTAPTTTGGALYSGYEFFFFDARAKERCATEIYDNNFISCVQQYLTVKFPAEDIKTILSARLDLVDTEGNIQNEKVRKEVQDLMRRRKNYQASQRVIENAQDVLKQSLLRLLSEDISSDSYRTKVLQFESDEAFRFALEGSETPKIQSLLAFRFPFDMKLKANADLVGKIIRSEPDSETQTQLLEQLREKGAENLSSYLQQILDERQRYKNILQRRREREEEAKPKTDTPTSATEEPPPLPPNPFADQQTPEEEKKTTDDSDAPQPDPEKPNWDERATP